MFGRRARAEKNDTREARFWGHVGGTPDVQKKFARKNVFFFFFK